MKTTTLFENMLREANYASLPEARLAIHSHALAPEYLVDLLRVRGVLVVKPDGSVVGAGPGGGAEEKDGGPKAWNPAWPRKRNILINLAGDETDPGLKFRKLQELLDQDGQPHTHWVTLHAVWNLMKEGLVEKRSDGYRLTKEGDKCVDAYHKADRDAFTQALREAGPPYDAKVVEQKLRAIPGHTWFEDGASAPGQDYINQIVASRKKAGEL